MVCHIENKTDGRIGQEENASSGRLSLMGCKSINKAESKLRAFAQQYVTLNFNGKQAAIAAGYSPRSAESTASELLRSPKVQALLQEFAGAALKNAQVTVQRIVDRLASIAFFDTRELYRPDGSFKPIKQLSAEAAANISSVEMYGRRGNKVRRIKVTDQLRAIRMLAEWQKMFVPDRNPVDLGVKYVVLDMPRPLRPASGAAQLPRPNGTNGD